jgi:hypothetical protein
MGWIKPAAIRLIGSATWDATAPACQPAEDLPPGRPEQRIATLPALRDVLELARVVPRGSRPAGAPIRRALVACN